MENNIIPAKNALNYFGSFEDMKITNKCKIEENRALFDKHQESLESFLGLTLFFQAPYLQDVPKSSMIFKQCVDQDTEDRIIPHWKMNYPHLSNIVSIIKSIPIEIVDEDPVPQKEIAIVDNNKTLGAYFFTHNSKGKEIRKEPLIKIWFNTIIKQDDNKTNDEHLKWWFTKVLLHEMAHAILDTYNYEFIKGGTVDKILYSYCFKPNDSFGKNIEEAMANAVTASIIKTSRNLEFYNYVKNFIIAKQPKGYIQGIKFFELNSIGIAEYVYAKRNGIDDSIISVWKNLLDESYWRCPFKITEEMVSKYYPKQFAADLPKYFKMEYQRGHSVIIDVDRRSNWDVNICTVGCSANFSFSYTSGKNIIESFIFAGLFVYIVLTQQEIYAVRDKDVQQKFQESTKWPLISTELANADCSLEKILEKTDLYPNEIERENFADMLDVVKTFMDKEIKFPEGVVSKNIIGNVSKKIESLRVGLKKKLNIAKSI